MKLILVDTSIWVDHLNRGDAEMSALLSARRCLMHEMVLGEVALGNLPNWSAKIGWLGDLPRAMTVGHDEYLGNVNRLKLQGSGLGFVDAHLLAWTIAEPGRRLWTRDRRLHERALTAGVAWTGTD